MSDSPDIVKNAATCTVCGSPADLEAGAYWCQKNAAHYADATTGLFDDHTYPETKAQP